MESETELSDHSHDVTSSETGTSGVNSSRPVNMNEGSPERTREVMKVTSVPRKRKWSEVEIAAVEETMMKCIHSGVTPGKVDCVACITAAPKALGERDWQAVKYYIKNRITAYERKTTKNLIYFGNEVQHTAEMSNFEGWSDIKLFNPEVKRICFELRPEMEKKFGIVFKIFIPVVYSSQLVAGTNYMFKVLVDADGDGECVHALIFQPLPCTGNKPNVITTQYPKSVDDPLIPLEHLQK